MAGLVDATLALASTHDPEELARLVAVGATDLFDADGAVVLLDDEEGGFCVTGEAGFERERLSVLERPDLLALLHDALRHPDGRLPEGGDGRLAEALGMAALSALPLRGSSEALGLALVVHEKPGEPPDQFTHYVVRTLSTQAGLGFERVRAARTLLDESLRDPLTGVGNRRAAMSALEGLKAGDVVALIDLDHFKRVNDSYGHAAGDRVLRTLGEFLRSSVRGPDEIFRLGGEEFLVIFGGAQAAGFDAVRRIHDRWRRQERVASFSAGAAVHMAGEAAERTVARADEALYEAKRRGRDRVVADAAGVAEEPGEEA
jgi:diguanylate cyclase (GGDEF)-like protein